MIPRQCRRIRTRFAHFATTSTVTMARAAVRRNAAIADPVVVFEKVGPKGFVLNSE
jgi:hypothetical protein